MANVPPPLVLAPLPVARPWGGRRAAGLLGLAAAANAPSQSGNPADASPPIGEWWLLSTRRDAPSRVVGGERDGATLCDLIADDVIAESLLGRSRLAAWRARFPLLLKVLDAAQPLSVQVHPSDRDRPGEGKVETWCFLATEPGSTFWLGLKPDCTPEEVVDLARRKLSPETLLARHEARPGTVAHLPPGTIHALGGGVVALEFQTNADVTYRIWDWGREPSRPLHLDSALKVAGREQQAQLPTPVPRAANGRGPAHDSIVECEAYSVERARLRASARFATDGDRFEILFPLGANARVQGTSGTTVLPRSHAALVPAGTGDYEVVPDGELELFRFVPAPRPSTQEKP